MPTLAERYAQKYAGAAPTNLKRGTTDRNLGAKPIPATKVIEKRPSNVEQFINKAGAVADQSLRLAGQGAMAAGKFVVNTGVDIGRSAVLAGKTFAESRTQPILNRRLEQYSGDLSRKQEEIVQSYKSGKMSKENYTKALKDISSAMQEISKESRKISGGPSPQERAISVAETATNALSLGGFTLAKVSTKQVGKQAIKEIIDESATTLEKVVLRVPAARQLVERNLVNLAKREAQQVAGETATQFIARESKHIAGALLVKRPLFYQQNIGDASKAYDQIISGDYDDALKTAAWMGTQMLEGGPIGAFFKGKNWLKGKLKVLAYGHQSFIDELSKRIGNGNASQIARFLTILEKKAPNEFKEANKTFRILQETNMRVANDDAARAAENVLDHYIQHGYNPANISVGQIYRDMSNWAAADEIAQRTLRSGLVRGISPEDAGKYVVVRWDQTARQGLIDAYRANGVQGVAELMQRPGVAWTNNQILVNQIEQVANTARTAAEFEDGIRAITTAKNQIRGIPKKVAAQLSRLGYTIAEPVGGRATPLVDLDDTRKLVTAAIRGETEIFDVATEPQPFLAGLVRMIESAGLSPSATNEVAHRKLSEAVVANLDELGMGARLGLKDTQGGDVVNGGRAILSRLQAYIENKRPVFGLGRSAAITDIRQLRIGEIGEALDVGKEEARAISKAIMRGYGDVPLELRGLGDKIVDTLYQVNPLQKHYSRIQSALRYTYNPFFRVQEATETRLLSRMQSHNLIWNKSRQELDESVRILDEAGIFTSSLPGEAAQDQVLGRITANITQGQKRDLAGLAEDIARARGLTLQQLVNEHSDEVDDALRVVVQYPRKGLLASPLARTMNLAFFPMRYNTKVTMLAAQTLAKQPPSVQKAVVHSLFSMRDWLKSDEGIRWQSEHSDALQVLQWVTPVNSISYVLNLLSGGPDSVAEMGVLGGLPLGVISQMLDSQGIIKLNKPYLDPKTGTVIPDYIPNSAKARAATAVGDLLNSMFTYPGRTLGLPGKNQAIRTAVRSFIDTNGEEFDKRLDDSDLTPLQRQWVRVLRGDTSDEAIDNLYNAPAPGQFNWYTLPPTGLPIRPSAVAPTKIEARRGLPTKASQKKAPKGPKVKKIAQPMPSNIAQPLQ